MLDLCEGESRLAGARERLPPQSDWRRCATFDRDADGAAVGRERSRKKWSREELKEQLGKVEPQTREHVKACLVLGDYLELCRRASDSVESERSADHAIGAPSVDVTVQMGVRKLAFTEKCHRCWMTGKHCFCSVLTQMAPEMIAPHSLSLYVHYDELLSSSNTGKLLYSAAPESIYIFGVRTHDATLLSSLNAQNTLVLWPSPDAPTITDYIRAHYTHTQKSYHLVVLDATWRRAATLNQRIPAEYQRVKLSATSQSVFGSMRDFAPDGSVHTAAACYQAFTEFGVSAAALAPLAAAIASCLSAYQAQSNKPLRRKATFAVDKGASPASSSTALHAPGQKTSH